MDSDGNRFPSVREVRVRTRPLIVIEGIPDNLPDMKGAIVWYKPSNLQTQTEIDAVLRDFKTRGVIRIKVLASQVDETLPQDARMTSPASQQTIRGVVAEMVEKLSVDVREGARGIIEGCLSRNGL